MTQILLASNSREARTLFRATWPTRARVALVCAALTGIYAAARAIHEPAWPTDFDQVWYAARALLDGGDPYAVVGPSAPFRWDWPLYYPLPAVLLSVPLALLAVPIARVAFSVFAAGVLGFAVGHRMRILWPLLLSASYLIATARTQWSPLLLAATWLPWAGVFVAAKPNIGLAALATLRGRRLAIGVAAAGALFIVSFAVRFDWFDAWRHATSVAPHILPPIALPGGFLLVLAALRWRRPDARLLLAMACVPHTPSLYDLLLLFYVCRRRIEALVLALLSHVLFWQVVAFGPYQSFDAYSRALGSTAIWLIYLPTLAVILLRSNVGEGEEVASENLGHASAVSWLASNRPEAVLLSVLVLAAALLVWLPLATYR